MGMAMGCATDKGSQSSNPDSLQMDVPRQITGIRVEKESGVDVVHIQGNTVLSYTSIKQPSPLKIILFFPETEIGNTVQTEPSDQTGIIGDISVSRVGGVQTGKVEIGLKQDVSYLVEREGNSLKVSFAGKSTEIAATKATDSIEETTLSESTLPSSTDAGIANDKTISRTYPVKPTKGDVKKSPSGAWVNRIDFSSEKKGKSTVIIGTTKPVEYRMEKVSPTALQLKLVRTNISDFRKLPLITTRFESALDRIRPLQTNAMKSDSVIAMDLRESVPYFVEQEGNVIKIHFEASSIPPRPDAPLATTFVEKVEEKPIARIEEATPSNQERASAIPPESKAVPAENRRSGVYRNDVSKVYSGEKMGIDFFDTDIRNVFRLLADYSGENFAIDKDVQGKVTLAFEKPVPWDQVLDLVLKMNQLDKVQDGGIIRIARLKTLEEEEKSKQQLFEAEKKAKEQSLELEPVMTEYIPVNYAKAQDEMKQHVEGLVTKRPDCSISVDERTNQLIITDTAAKLQHIRSIVQKLDRVTPQVVIEAKIVEATTDFSRELGVKWNAQWGIQNTDANAGVGPQPGYDTLGGTHGGTASVNFPVTAANYGTIGFNFMRLAGTPIIIDAQLQAMEANKNGKIISAPKILTLDNKEANIEQGLEVGYMEKGKTDEAPTTKFKKVVLHLKVVPHITLDNRISMKIEILKDDVVSYTSTGVPTIATKKALTELLVDDGDTLVIGGITKSSETIGDEGIPYLAKIPLLGYLFGTKSNKKTMEELLIFMTPRIVQLEQRAESGNFNKS
jgi:type IV pilus assembly protein PilQ